MNPFLHRTKFPISLFRYVSDYQFKRGLLNCLQIQSGIIGQDGVLRDFFEGFSCHANLCSITWCSSEDQGRDRLIGERVKELALSKFTKDVMPHRVSRLVLENHEVQQYHPGRKRGRLPLPLTSSETDPDPIMAARRT
jgi:hypothetical protein